jgi:WD40 repeat protein
MTADLPKKRGPVTLCKLQPTTVEGIWFWEDDKKLAVGTQFALHHVSLPNKELVMSKYENMRGLVVDPKMRWFVCNRRSFIAKYSMLPMSASEPVTFEVPREDGDGIVHVAVSSDGQRLALMCENEKVRVLLAQTLELLFEVETGQQGLFYAAFAPDGGFVTGSESHLVHRWTAEGKFMFSMDTGERICESLVVSPSGKRLMTGNVGGFYKIWDIITGQLVTILGDRIYCILCALFVNEDMCFTSSGNYTVSVWDAKRGTCLKKMHHEWQVEYVCVSHDGMTLATCGSDGVTRLYHNDALPWSEWLRFRFDGRNFKAMTPRFRREARTFLLCCLRHRREGGVLEWLPRDMRQLILVWASQRDSRAPMFL